MALFRCSSASGGGGSIQFLTSGGSTSTSTTISGLTAGKKYLVEWVSGSSGASAAQNRATVTGISGGTYTDLINATTFRVSSSLYTGYSAQLVTASSTSITVTRAAADNELYEVFELD